MGIDVRKTLIGSIVAISKISGIAFLGYVIYRKTESIPFAVVTSYATFLFVYALKYRRRSKFYRRLSETDLPIKILSGTPNHFSGQKINEAAQGQFVFASNHEIVATSHVEQCNLLVGYCKELGLAFLCHADLQFWIGDMNEFFKSLDARIEALMPKELKNDNTKYSFKTTLVGGQTHWIYPYATRTCLIKRIENSTSKFATFDLQITEMPTSLRTFALSMNAKSGQIDGYYQKTIKAKRQGRMLHESNASYEANV
ncbi:hypothetical protein A3767_01325 [Oleiphilus sp. HI0133]|nr:hypothetical protein A3767_01325 [Oleiphilus sp. HI0133]